MTDSIYHPEWVDGRRLWMDGAMRDLIHRLHHGDPVIGWEGDPRLGIYWVEPEQRWELWRLEDDGQYRMVCRSPVGGVFDERLLHDLCQWDRNRRTRSIHDEIVDHNARRDAEIARHREEWVNEDIGPRLRHAVRKEADW